MTRGSDTPTSALAPHQPWPQVTLAVSQASPHSSRVPPNHTFSLPTLGPSHIRPLGVHHSGRTAQAPAPKSTGDTWGPTIRASHCYPHLLHKSSPNRCSAPPSPLHSWGHLVLSGRQGLRNVHCEVWQGGFVIGPGPQVSACSSAFSRESGAASSQPPLAAPHWRLFEFPGQMVSRPQSDLRAPACLLPPRALTTFRN